jgi:hypothetical protein
MNQRKKGYQPAPYWNEPKSFPRKYFYSNNQKTEGGGKPINLGKKKFWDNPSELLKCWESGEPHLRGNYPCLTSAVKTTVHNLQEASTMGDVGKNLHQINAAMDGCQANHQSSVVEILIDPGDTLSYITPSIVESNKLKKTRHGKSWLVQLAT